MKLLCWFGKHSTVDFRRKRRNGDVSLWQKCRRCGRTELIGVLVCPKPQVEFVDAGSLVKNAEHLA